MANFFFCATFILRFTTGSGGSVSEYGRGAFPVVDKLQVSDFPKGEITALSVEMVEDGLGTVLAVPVIVMRGRSSGPVLGLTAAVHGNELNGIGVIHRLRREINPSELKGTVVAVPVVNIPGYVRHERTFLGEFDLNRVMPGRENGNAAELYAHRFLERVVSEFTYLIDLHTASFGRINSLYIRADMTNEISRDLAFTQGAQIIVHSPKMEGSLRAAAMQRGIPGITVEIGDPQRSQTGLIQVSTLGVRNSLIRLGMLEGEIPMIGEPPVLCKKSYWLYTDKGGFLEVTPPPASYVRKGQVVARVSDIYGEVTKKYEAPESGVVIGKSTNPVNQAGDRILSLGIPGTLEDCK